MKTRNGASSPSAAKRSSPLPTRRSNLSAADTEGSGLFPARTKDSWVYLDTAGKEALRFPEKLQNALSFKDGAAGIKVRGKWGIIDPTGQFTAEPSYDEYHPL